MRRLVATLACLVCSSGLAVAGPASDARAAREQSLFGNYSLAVGAQIDTAGNIARSIERDQSDQKAGAHRIARNARRVHVVGGCRFHASGAMVC